jgi:hypothetical protein
MTNNSVTFDKFFQDDITVRQQKYYKHNLDRHLSLKHKLYEISKLPVLIDEGICLKEFFGTDSNKFLEVVKILCCMVLDRLFYPGIKFRTCVMVQAEGTTSQAIEKFCGYLFYSSNGYYQMDFTSDNHIRAYSNELVFYICNLLRNTGSKLSTELINLARDGGCSPTSLAIPVVSIDNTRFTNDQRVILLPIKERYSVSSYFGHTYIFHTIKDLVWRIMLDCWKSNTYDTYYRRIENNVSDSI